MGDDILMDDMVSSDKDNGAVNCRSSDNEEEETEITGMELEDVLGFLEKMGETLSHSKKRKRVTGGGGMALMGTATLNSCEEVVETSIVLAIEWKVIGSHGDGDVFTQVLCRSPVKSLPQSELETKEVLEKFKETLLKTITVSEGMAFMESLALNSCPVREKVETPIVLALERRMMIDSNKKFEFNYEVIHRLLVKYLSPSPSEPVPEPESTVEEKYPYPYENPSNFLVSKCVKNPCDFSIPRKADPPTGLFVPCPDFGYDLIWLDPLTSTPPVPSMEKLIMFIPLPSLGRFDIICSCNGVLLCSFGFYNQFYLWNPTLKIFTTLPKLDGLVHKSFLKDGFIDMVIAFDPCKSPEYRVIALREMIMKIPKNYYRCKSNEELKVQIMKGIDGNTREPQVQIQIAVYSPQTGVWRDFCHEALILKESTKFHGHGVFCKDAIYWLQPQRVVCFNLVEEKLQYMDHPTTLMYPDQDLCQRRREAITRDFLVKSGQDTLLYVCLSLDYEDLLVWQLGRDDDSKDLRWSSRYSVDLETVCSSNGLPDCTSFDVVYFMDSENEENVFVVFRANANGKVIRYDMASGNSYQLGDTCYKHVKNHSYSWFDSGHRSYCFPFQRGTSGDEDANEDANEELYSLFPVPKIASEIDLDAEIPWTEFMEDED